MSIERREVYQWTVRCDSCSKAYTTVGVNPRAPSGWQLVKFVGDKNKTVFCDKCRERIK